MPPRVAALPRDPRGYPVPFAAAEDGGRPLLGLLSLPKLLACHRRRLCLVCGGPLGELACFVGGPGSVRGHTFGEAPGHPDCALYAVRACPALNGEMARRVPAPDGSLTPPGTVEALPEVVAVYACRRWRVLGVRGTLVFRPGNAAWVRWFRGGAEVDGPTHKRPTGGAS
jgi:hypothetical protein